jgi:hypothetical protein
MAHGLKRSDEREARFFGCKSVLLGLLLFLLGGMITSAPITTVAHAQKSGWEEVPISEGVFQRFLSPVVYDPINARFEFFGGSGPRAVYSDTIFFYPGNDTFLSVNTFVHPSQRYLPAMSFDEACGCAVLFGGAYKQTPTSEEFIYNDTWLFFSKNDSWTEVTPAVSPPVRHMAGMVYSSSTRTDLLFGGTDGMNYNDLWSFNTTTLSWTMQQNYTLTTTLTNRPLNRFAFGMASTDDGTSFLVFGGGGVNESGARTQYFVYDDTWVYSATQQSWSNLTSGVHPSGRAFPAIASSPEYGITLMFGGSAGADPFATSNYLSDTWVFDQSTNAWHELNITGPPAIFGASLGYDPISRSFVLFGGKGNASVGISNEVWRLNASVILSLIGKTSSIELTSVALVICVPAVASVLVITWVNKRRLARSRGTQNLTVK